jgi:hypothetical protein
VACGVLTDDVRVVEAVNGTGKAVRPPASSGNPLFLYVIN